MNWKLLFTFVIFMALGYSGYLAVQLYLSGQPFTITTFLEYTMNQTTTLIGQITGFIQQKLELVLSIIGGLIASVVGIYRLITTKISNIKATAQNQVEETQAQMTQQYTAMQSTINEQKEQISTLQTQVSDKTTLQTQLSQSQTDLQKLQDNFKLQAAQLEEARALANVDYIRYLQEMLKRNSIPYENYPAETVTVVK